MSNIIFLAHGELDDEEVRRVVRARAAEHSHRSGERKPKTSKNPNARKRKRTRPLLVSSLSEPSSRRGSEASLATSSATTHDDHDDDDHEDGQQRALTPQPAHMTRIGAFQDDPFDSYPVPSEPWFPRLLDYMWPFMLRGWQALETTQEEQETALHWVKRLTMSNPCYFYINMLSVSGDMATRGLLDRSLIPWHCTHVVKAINSALADSQRALTVGTILAVGRIALHDIILGDFKSGMTLHRPAFARMIVMAGGLDKLELPTLVRTHLGWANCLMTLKSGVSIGEIEPTLADEPSFKLERTADNVLAVLDRYIPMREATRTLPEMPHERPDLLAQHGRAASAETI